MSVNTSSPVIIYLMAAFPSGSTPSVRGVTFSLTYDPAEVEILDEENTADFALRDGAWPAPDVGTALTWDSPLTTTLCEIAWFTAYTGTEIGATFGLAPHPTQGGHFSDNSEPPLLDPVRDYGAIGINTLGHRALPWDEVASPPDNSATLWAYLRSGAAEVLTEADQFWPIESARLHDSAVRDALFALGATSLRKTFLGSTSADTIGIDRAGRSVRLLDLSGCYSIGFEDSLAADAALAELGPVPGVLGVRREQVPSQMFTCPSDCPTNDPILATYQGAADPLWALVNDNERPPNGACTNGPGDEAYDIGVRDLAEWRDGTGASGVIVAGVDNGLWDAHPDLSAQLVDLSNPTKRARYQKHIDPSADFCSGHATKMAGLMAASTDNGQGIAGVCPKCKLLEIYSTVCNLAECQAVTAGTENSYCDAVSYQHAYSYMYHAMGDAFDEGQVYAFHCPFGTGQGFPPSLGDLLVYENAYRLGIVPVASAGNSAPPQPTVGWPAAFPSVMGIGGTNQNGYFWVPATNCTTSGACSGVDAGTPVGEYHVSMSAPASGPAVTTNAHPLGSTDYAYTSICTSGSSALVAGAVGFLQTQAIEMWGEPLPADDAAGILAASASEYAIDPTDPSVARCASCPREFYGTGNLDVEAAVFLLSQRENWHYRVLHVQDLDDVETMTEFSVFGVNYQEYKYQGSIQLSPVASGGGDSYAAWVRRVSDITQPNFNTRSFTRYHWPEVTVAAADAKMYGAEIGPVSTSGEVTVTAYFYRREVSPGTWEFVGGVNPGVLAVQLVSLGPIAVGVGEQHPPTAVRDRAQIDRVVQTDDEVRFECFIPKAGETKLTVWNVSGRRLWGTSLAASSGSCTVRWRLGANRGEVTRGVYFARLEGGATVDTKRLVILR
ncbi:MAG: S8 family peptidase [Candidatus Eisenbacteria bacterium]|nr:S8 family peptidase [Candidatus Eisenbacteria bacterium]